jgi:hypothetical protein
MINLTAFKLTNNSGANITLQSLDNFVLSAGASNIDLFDPVNGGFVASDILENTEIQNYLLSGSIVAADQNNLNIRTLTPIFGQLLTELNPPTITATQDNYTPAGWQTARYINLTPSGTQFISGFAATFHGDIKIIRNNTTSSALFLLNNAAGSLPENRILTAENTTFALKKYSTVNIMYDNNLARWVCMSMEKP